MIIVGRRSSLLLLVGDIAAFAVSLYLALWLRYRAVPGLEMLAPYLVPFALLFVLWALVFYGAGLYGKRIALFPSRMPDTLLVTQTINVILAAIFFFLIPVFGIAPKTILVLYLVLSLVLLYLWRLVLYPRISVPRERERVALVGAGPESDALLAEVNGNPRYGIELIPYPSITSSIQAPHQTVPFEDIYEEVFDRIPLSELERAWFSKHVSLHDSLIY